LQPVPGIETPALAISVRYLTFELSDDTGCVTTLDAMASTSAEQHPAVMAEVKQVLDWAWQRFPHTHGPVDDGMDWDDHLQVCVEEGGWHTVTLTLGASRRFVEEFVADFGDPRA
jgi:hypothetical protein